MKPREDVAVFHLEQDSHLEQPCMRVSRAEARELKKAGKGWFVDHGKSFRLMDRAPVQEQTIADFPSLPDSSCSISMSEMLANVGIWDETGRSPRIPLSLVARAQAKVRLYPHVFDLLAPTARGSWLNPVSLQVMAEV